MWEEVDRSQKLWMLFHPAKLGPKATKESRTLSIQWDSGGTQKKRDVYGSGIKEKKQEAAPE
jgi:hypothetical protein